jgi:3-dehydro-4-phosphotetronate decarboxylase
MRSFSGVLKPAFKRFTEAMADLETQARQSMVRLGASLYQRGYTVGTAGNLSVRLADGFLITPTDACLGYLEASSISKLDVQCNWVSGAKPSKTIALHKRIYEANSDTNGIVHTHSTHLVALTLRGGLNKNNILRPITPYQVMKVGPVPLIDYDLPGAQTVADKVAELATENSNSRAVMLERLGPVVWSQTLEKACFVLEELEETAKLMMLCPSTTELSIESIAALNKQFNCNW